MINQPSCGKSLGAQASLPAGISVRSATPQARMPALPGVIFILFRASHCDMKAPAENCRANWPLCLVFPKDCMERVKAKRPVCPTLAPRFSLFHGVATRPEYLSGNRRDL